MLESEMDQQPSYSKYDYQNKATDDSRNGYSNKAVTSSLGEIDLDVPRDRKGELKWDRKYPSSVASWRNNRSQLSTYFKYPPEIKKTIYTMNSIENFNRQLRKVTKSKTIFPTDDALFKILYLAMCDITEKWTGAG